MPNSDHLGFSEALGAAASNPPDPRQAGYALEVAGFPERTVATCEQGIKAQFEQYVRKRARAAATDAEQAGDWFEASRLRALYTHEFALGWYSWTEDGRNVLAFRNTGAGNSYLLYLLIRRCDPRVSQEDVDRMFYTDIPECQRALEWALGNSPPPPRKTTAGASQPTTTTTEPMTLDSP